MTVQPDNIVYRMRRLPHQDTGERTTKFTLVFGADAEGALGVYQQKADAERLADMLGLDVDELRKNAKTFSFPFSAPYGKEKRQTVSFVVIPPRANRAEDAPRVSSNEENAPDGLTQAQVNTQN